MRRTGLLLACLALAVPALALAAAPTATTEAIDIEGVEQDYALLNGIINPGGTQTSYYFEYGPTDQYGQVTPTIPIGNGRNDVGISVGVDGLTPATTYHYRLVAKWTPTQAYAAGLAFGADQTFTTLPTPPPLALAITSGKKATIDAKGFTSFTLACTGPAGQKCDGLLTLKLKVKLPGAKKAKTVEGQTFYKLKVGATKTAKVRLPKAVADAVADGAKLKATAKAKTRLVKAPVVSKVSLVPAG